VPQVTFPAASVWRFPVQEMRVWSLRPPPVRTRPLIVDEAEVTLSALVWIPPVNEEVAAEVLVSEPPVMVTPWVEESPAVEIPPANVEVAVVVATITPNCPRPMSAVDAWRVVFEAIPPAKVEVAVEVEVIEPVVKTPVVRLEKMPEMERKMFAKSEVEVALVVLELAKV
jgi:hypothetical protein